VTTTTTNIRQLTLSPTNIQPQQEKEQDSSILLLPTVDGWNVLVVIVGSTEIHGRGLPVGDKGATGFFVMISALGDTLGALVLIDGLRVPVGDCVGELLIDGQGVTVDSTVNGWNLLVAIVGSAKIDGRRLTIGVEGATGFFVMISALGVSEEQQQIEPVDFDNDDNANAILQLKCENLIGGLDATQLSQRKIIFSRPSPTKVLSSSSSLLVPLYPHQGIITPLPHCTDSATFDNSNDVYTYCQESLQS